jgi:pimeloyl-ACP methyl ester carboxylesterase
MAPTLVLLPGMDGTGEHFAPLLAVLTDRFPTLVVRYPDEPLDYQHYEQIARAALPQDRPFILLGESFSGPIALSIAADPPAGLVAYVLCASFASCPHWILRVVRPFLEVIPTHRVPNAVAAYFLMGRFATPELRRANAAALRRVSPRTLSARLKAVAEVDVSEKLGRIRVPGLYLRGTEDRLVPAAICHALARTASNVHVVEIEGPHFLLQVSPQLAAKAIADFVSSPAVAANYALERTRIDQVPKVQQPQLAAQRDR